MFHFQFSESRDLRSDNEMMMEDDIYLGITEMNL